LPPVLGGVRLREASAAARRPGVTEAPLASNRWQLLPPDATTVLSLLFLGRTGEIGAQQVILIVQAQIFLPDSVNSMISFFLISKSLQVELLPSDAYTYLVYFLFLLTCIFFSKRKMPMLPESRLTVSTQEGSTKHFHRLIFTI
jgi:hypothetical protein